MFDLLACPNCKVAYDHQTESYNAPLACDHCGTLLLLRRSPYLHLVLVCRKCHEIFEGLFGQFGPGMLNRCPQCSTPLGLPEVRAMSA